MIYLPIGVLTLIIICMQWAHSHDIKNLHIRLSESEHANFIVISNIWKELQKREDYVVTTPEPKVVAPELKFPEDVKKA